MGMDPALLEFFPDEVTIEPFTSMTAQQVSSYGAAVTYAAQIISMSERVIGPDRRELTSSARVIIPERVCVDSRSRITLPASFVPNQPPILAVRPAGGALGLDHTEILL